MYRSDWVDLSGHALEFVKNMLRKNPETRLTTDEALAHPFLAEEGKRTVVKPSVLKKLAKGNSGGYLKKEIFTILSTYVKSETIERWNKCFNELDQDGTGEIRISEVIKVLKESNINESRIIIIEEMYKDKMDTPISYSDFLAKVINIRREIREEDVRKAFDQLDINKKGKISTEDLSHLLQRRGHDSVRASTLLKEVDQQRLIYQPHEQTLDNSGTMPEGFKRKDISYETFKEHFLGGVDDGASEMSEYT